jgi:hypothetical protein
MFGTQQYNLYEPHINDLRTQAHLHQIHKKAELAGVIAESRIRTFSRALLAKMGLVDNQEYDSSIESYSPPVLHL